VWIASNGARRKPAGHLAMHRVWIVIMAPITAAIRREKCSGATKWMWADERRSFKAGWSRRRKRDDDDNEEVELNDVYTISKAVCCVRIEWRDC
jgi:hypothetical protein